MHGYEWSLPETISPRLYDEFSLQHILKCDNLRAQSLYSRQIYGVHFTKYIFAQINDSLPCRPFTVFNDEFFFAYRERDSVMEQHGFATFVKFEILFA